MTDPVTPPPETPLVKPVPAPAPAPVVAEEPEEDEVDEVQVRLEKMEKYMNAVPGAAFAYVARNYLFPLLHTMHEQYGSDVLALWDAVEEAGGGADESESEGAAEVIEGAKDAIMASSSLMDNLMVRLGYVKGADLAPDVPPEVVAAYQAARVTASRWADAYKAWLGDEEPQP